MLLYRDSPRSHSARSRCVLMRFAGCILRRKRWATKKVFSPTHSRVKRTRTVRVHGRPFWQGFGATSSFPPARERVRSRYEAQTKLKKMF